jgi:hypothetical protein
VCRLELTLRALPSGRTTQVRPLFYTDLRPENEVSSLRSRTFPTARMCLTGQRTKLEHDAFRIFHYESKVVNDPDKANAWR